MKLTKKDEELIQLATELVNGNCDIYEDKSLHVACALRAKSGKVYKGVNIKTSHSVCAEQVALGQALACGEREFETIVAVKINEDEKTRIVSPCGLCRYIFDKFKLDFDVIVEDSKNNKVIKVKASELLPYPYKR